MPHIPDVAYHIVKMEIELIPVIEIGYNNQDIPKPEKYPYWENQSIWDLYQKESLKKAGFVDECKPYFKGSPFFEPKEITEANLRKIVLDHTKGLREEEYDREGACCLFGGYVLKVNGKNKLFPQCCSDLGDIKYWEKLSNKQNSFCEGHPAPNYEFKNDLLILDFTTGKYEEYFEPTPPDMKLSMNIHTLKIAVDNTKTELQKLANRLKTINLQMNLGIERIDDLLIWENPNHD